MASTVKERKVLTLEDSVKVIRLLESGKISWILAEQFGVGRTRIPQTLKRKAELLSDYKNNANLDSEGQRRATGNEDIKEIYLSKALTCMKIFLYKQELLFC